VLPGDVIVWVDNTEHDIMSWDWSQQDKPKPLKPLVEGFYFVYDLVLLPGNFCAMTKMNNTVEILSFATTVEPVIFPVEMGFGAGVDQLFFCNGTLIYNYFDFSIGKKRQNQVTVWQVTEPIEDLVFEQLVLIHGLGGLLKLPEQARKEHLKKMMKNADLKEIFESLPGSDYVQSLFKSLNILKKK
jgi:hypothetical protein